MTGEKVASRSETLLLDSENLPSLSESVKAGLKRFRPVTSIVVLAWAVRLASLYDMLNAVLRYQPKFIYWLGKWVPFEITEGHRIRMFLTSVLLFVLASGLQRGKRRAFQITIAGLLLAPILHLGRDVLWPQAVINLTLIAFLFVHRRYFVVESDPRSFRSAAIICPILAAALLAFGTIRLHALHKHTLGDHSWEGCFQTACELVFVHRSHTQFAFTSHSKDLFLLLRVGGTGVALTGLVLILRPVLSRRFVWTEHVEQARRIVAEWGTDPLDSYALLRDKSYFFSEDQRSVVPYALSGNLAVALAGPIGPPDGRQATIVAFADFCRRLDWEPVFYEIDDKLVSYYADAGFSVFKIGEEARLRADHFRLKGRDFQNLRTACNSAAKANLRFHWYEPDDGIDEALEHQLTAISRQWLAAKKGPEMTFDMGSYSVEEIRRNGAAVALDDNGQALAFATWRPFAHGRGRALDLMRSLPKRRNIMDFVLVESIFHFRDRDIHDISLGNAPLANTTSQNGTLLAEEKAVQFVFQNLNQIYGYKPLFEFKRKYRPQWRGRYVAYRRGVSLPLIGLAMVRVHAPGAIWKLLTR
jgi:phosphatidylglycerol lysyltransferase